MTMQITSPAPSHIKVQLQEFDSEAIARAGYDANTRTFALVYRSNPNFAYLYQSVAPEIWASFLDADSKGTWCSDFHTNEVPAALKVYVSEIEANANTNFPTLSTPTLMQVAPNLPKLLSSALAEAIEALQQAKNTNNTKLAETATDMVMSLTNLLQDAVQA